MQAECENIFDIVYNLVHDPLLVNRISPLFYDYYASVFEPDSLRYFLQQQRLLFGVLENNGREILEIGCGFGLILICQSLFGARKCTGIDISKEMIDDFSVLREYFSKYEINAMLGDFLQIEFAKDSFDRIIIKEAISHIRDTNLLLDKIRDILRPGGIVYISDENNDLFLPSRLKSRRAWKVSEIGPVPENIAKYGRNVDKLCFLDARMEIIKRAFPLIDEEKVKYLSKKTQGLYGDILVRACEEFIATGKYCAEASFPYRNPYTGEFPELGISPFKLAKELRIRGFRSFFMPPFYSYLGPAPGYPRWKDVAAKISRIIFRFPERIFPFISPKFQLIAKKLSKVKS